MESSKLTNIILDGDFDAFEWGWYVDPDPTTMLNYMTCDQRGSWSDSWYCNDAYDKLYDQETVELDQDKRVDDGPPDAADALRGRALPRDGVQHHRRGLPQRPVRLLRASSPTRVACGSSSTASTTTCTCGRRPRPATAAA